MKRIFVKIFYSQNSQILIQGCILNIFEKSFSLKKNIMIF